MKTAVVVPSYNRPDKLGACLRALAALDPAPDEIVVVDDGSPTPLSPVCKDFARVRCLRQANAGPGAARNAGVRASGADLMLLTDDDCRPRPDWLAVMAARHRARPDALFGGNVVNALTDNLMAAASQSLTDFLYRSGGAETGGAEFFTTNNVAFSRRVFEEIGGFDAGFPRAAGEDRDFGQRWRAAGHPLIYVPEAVVEHHHDMNFRGYWRQQSNYGRGARLLHDRMAARPASGPKFQTLPFYFRLMSHPLRDGGPRPLARTGLMVLSQFATAVGYFRQSHGGSGK